MLLQVINHAIAYKEITLKKFFVICHYKKEMQFEKNWGNRATGTRKKEGITNQYYLLKR